jgi:hypothetical protein
LPWYLLGAQHHAKLLACIISFEPLLLSERQVLLLSPNLQEKKIKLKEVTCWDLSERAGI